jgi:abequosyltransferase
MTRDRSEVLLSVCVASLNRCDFLMETIERFSEQMLDGVELVVIDGGSTDSTQAMMERAAKTHKWISYYRLITNGGIDADYDKSVRFAKGQHCWLFSDDDWPLPGALKVIVDACGMGHDFIFADAEVRDLNMGSVLLQKRAVEITEDRVLQGHEIDTLFKLTGSALSFIGSTIISRKLWLERDCESYFGYYFPHLAVLFQKPLSSTSLLISKPLVAIRFGNATWSSKSFKIWMILWPELIWRMPGISDTAKASVVPRHPWRSFKTLMWQRAKGAYTHQEYSELLVPFGPNLLTRLRLILVSAIPPTLAILIARVAILRAGKDERYQIEELRLSPFCQTGVGRMIANFGK